MLTERQEQMLGLVPQQALYLCEPFDPRVREMAYRIMDDLMRALPQASIHFIGSSQLGIAGSNKVDIFIVSRGDAENESKALEGLFGIPSQGMITQNERVWEGSRNGFLIMVHYFPTFEREIQPFLDAHSVLAARGDLRQAYETLKYGSRGKPLHEYLRKKFEFFNMLVNPVEVKA